MGHRHLVRLSLVASLMLSALSAHPHALNPESIDRHAEITLTSGQMVVVYEILLGINPTGRAVQELDANQDKNISEEERNAFVKKYAAQYAPKQIIQLGETTLPLQFVQGDAYRTIGHNGIDVLKIDVGYTCSFPASLPRETTLSFQYRDGNLEKTDGWKQISFVGVDGVRFSGHIPYKDFGKFDYDIIETKGFIPATDEINIEVSLPPRGSNPSIAKIVMPIKEEIDLVQMNSGLDLLFTIWFILGGIFVVIALVFVGFRWRNSSSRSNSQ